MKEDLYLRMMEMIKTGLELNSENKVVALLWHQGETDADRKATREEHYNNLSKLIQSVRNTFGYPELPFVAGDFVKQWKDVNIEMFIPVIEAIKDVCRNIRFARFVETDKLLSNEQKINNGDTIHFCRDSLNKLGIKYFNAFCDIRKIEAD